MQKNAPPMTPASLAFATRVANSSVRDALTYADKLTTDPQKAQRLEKGLCKACFYAPPRVAGAAVTTQPCMCCSVPQSYGSTATDVLCLPCSKEHALCKKCGGDIEMRADRADWPASKHPGGRSP